MNEKLTEKSRAAITEAQGQALDRHNPTLEPEHLLAALAKPADGLLATLIRSLGREPSALQARIESSLARLPVGHGDEELRASSRFARLMREAGRVMEARGD